MALISSSLARSVTHPEEQLRATTARGSVDANPRSGIRELGR